MADPFALRERADQRLRIAALVLAVVALGLAARVTQTSLAWIDRPFPGFVTIRNLVVAAIALPDWRVAGHPEMLTTQLETVDGVPVESLNDLAAMIAGHPTGTSFKYGFRRLELSREVTLESQTFTLRDWTILFGGYLLNGVVFFSSGLLAWMVRPRSRLARAFFAFGASSTLFLFTAMDLYGPSDLFVLHLASEALVPAAALQLLLVFPEEHRLARWRFAGYPVAAAFFVLFVATTGDPQRFLDVFEMCSMWLGLTGLLFGLRLLHATFRARSALARQRMRVVAIGTIFGIALPGLILLASRATGGALGMNAVVFTFFLFPVSLAYAIVQHDLFDIDAMVKRAAYYLVFTGAVGAAYAGAVFVLNAGLAGADLLRSPLFPVLFSAGVLLIFDPLRRGLQRLVDRVFFRTDYDGARILAETGSRLAATLRLDEIARLVSDAVCSAFPSDSVAFFLCAAGGDRLREISGDRYVPEDLARALTNNRILTVEDSPQGFESSAVHAAVVAALRSLGGYVAVPVNARGRLVGCLVVGAKRSGAFFTSGDAEFLRALSPQVSIAAENARSYEALVEFNAQLETRVEERTAELATTNEALADAYADLKSAEVQIVQSAKMASLGRLAAGIAHEINNPLSFIASNVEPLRDRLERFASAAPEARERILSQARTLLDLMAKGAKRTVAIVDDLRSFSRINQAIRTAVDLREGLEVTIRLLEMRWRDRIAIHREYQPIPMIECDAGQINQVFMNVLANACDAIDSAGEIWVGTRADHGRIVVTVRDSGCGIPEDVRQRIFEPFFTTKDVGRGTGLGLAIAHGIVTAHHGSMDVQSAPGQGSTVEITLPLPTATDAAPTPVTS